MVFGSLVLSASWGAAMFYHQSIPFIVLLMVFMGVTSAFLYAMLPIVIAQEAPPERTSEVTGMMAVVRATATSVGAQVVAYLLSTSTVTAPDGNGNFPDSQAYMITMGYIAGGIFLVCLMYLVFSRVKKAS